MKTTLLILAIVCIAGVAAQTTSGCPPGMYSYVAGKICADCHWSCKTCSGSGSDACTECYIGEPDNGSCDLSAIVGCAQPLCSVSNTYACGECLPGARFAMKDATTATAYCVDCSQTGCATCTVDACQACFDGYFMDTTSSSCKQCDTGCAACTGAGACTTCDGAYFSNAGSCTACSDGCVTCESATKCTTCNDQYLLSQTAFTCTLSEGCLTPSTDGTKCSACYDGYRLLNDGTCKSCDTNAAICSTNSADQSQVPIACNGINYILATKTTAKAAVCASRNEGACVDQTADGVCNKCDAGWTLSTGKCVDCDSISSGCSKCTDGGASAASTCTSCVTGYYFASGACVSCDSSCASCDATSCTCASGYYPNNPATTSCNFCNAGGAKAGCTEKNASSGCLSEYGSYSHGICAACDPTLNCLTCETLYTCKTCKNGTSLKGGACVTCDSDCTPVNGCSVSGAGKCDTTCVDLTIDTLNNVCGSDCLDSNCTACGADLNVCTACKDGFWVNNNACSSCASNCKTCTGSTTALCSACLGGYLFGQGLTTSPTTCTVLCSTLNVANAFQAANAESCIMTAVETAPSDIVCNSGFLKQGVIACISPPTTGCTGVVAATGVCNACGTGYVQDSDNNACLACGSGTGISDTANTARYTCSYTSPTHVPTFTACAANHYLGSDNKCYTKDTICSYTATTTVKSTVSGDKSCDKDCSNATASDYVYLDATTKKCTACPTGCTACSNATTCSTCDNANGYYLNTTGGTSCVIPSLKCLTWTVADKCATCRTDQYITTSFTCTNCAPGCATCTSTACTACLTSTGYLKDASATTFTCKACISNCDACSDFTTCTTCKLGYYKSTTDSTCVACPTNAATCTDSKTVQTCVANYFVFGLPSDTAGVAINPVAYCKECTSNCLTCTIDDKAASVCTLCDAKGNYYLTNDGKSCSNADCSGSDGKLCNQCDYGQRLDSTAGACADCTADNSCPASCEADTTTGGGTGVDNNNTTSATDSGSKIAFSLFVLAFIAILGHMMI